jgi:hypothetical protein
MIRDMAAAPPRASRPLSVNESRNLKVVAILIAAMTVGGGLLLSMEAPRPRWSSATLLAAERVEALSGLTIELLPADAPALAEYDCVLLPSGECRWQPSDPHVRLALVSAGTGQLPEEQLRKLLELLGSLSQAQALDLRLVQLDARSDPRATDGLGPEADALLALLQRKGIVQ